MYDEDIEKIKFKTDVKHILDCIDNLTPWDKTGLFAYLLHNIEMKNEMESILQAMGYVDYDKIDVVDEVSKQNLEEEVLNGMTDSEIIDYVATHGLIDDVVDWCTPEEIVEIINDGKRNFALKEILTEIKKNHPNILKDWLKDNVDIKVEYELKEKEKK